MITISHGKAQRSDHPSTLPARLDLAFVLQAGGRITAAADLDLRSVLNRQKTIYGAHHFETLLLVDRFADILDKIGQHSRAIGYHVEALSGNILMFKFDC